MISGRDCEPCSALLRDVEAQPAPLQAPYDLVCLQMLFINCSVNRPTQVKHTPFLTLIWRYENVGMDLASHNVTLEWAASVKRLGKYSYFIFLNSSARGPFVPNYLPPGWAWPDAFLRFFVGDVKVPDVIPPVHSTCTCPTSLYAVHACICAAMACTQGVAAAISCLPEEDVGGPGPRMESWAFALDAKGLAAVVAGGAFARRTCKLCDDGIVVDGEYKISKVRRLRTYLHTDGDAVLHRCC